MRIQWKGAWTALPVLFAAATLALAEPTRMPRPGALNSVQGQVNLNGHAAQAQPLRQEDLGTGQAVKTQHGKAELLLTPGNFLRIGNYSQVQMLSPSLENPTVKVVAGKAILDAFRVHNSNLAVIMDGTKTTVDHRGLYGFNAGSKTISVLWGKATVYRGDSRHVIKAGHQLDIANWHVRKFDKHAFKSTALFQWNEMRNRNEAHARRSIEANLANSGHWYGPGWYWSNYWGFYAYLRSPGNYAAAPYPYGPFYGSYSPWGWGLGWGWGWDWY